jgi:large subunit ribosomal protein L31e
MEKEEKIVLERKYIIPVRRGILKVVSYTRSNAAVREIKRFICRHMKTTEDNIRIGKWLNQEVWKRGIRNPPTKFSVKTTKNDKGIVRVELAELSKKSQKIEEKERNLREAAEKTNKEKAAAKKAEEEAKKKEAEGKEETEEEKIEEEKEKILLKDGIGPMKKEMEKVQPKNNEMMAKARKSVGRAETHGA